MCSLIKKTLISEKKTNLTLLFDPEVMEIENNDGVTITQTRDNVEMYFFLP